MHVALNISSGNCILFKQGLQIPITGYVEVFSKPVENLTSFEPVRTLVLIEV